MTEDPHFPAQFTVVIEPNTVWQTSVPCYTFAELFGLRAELEAKKIPYRMFGPWRVATLEEKQDD